MAKNKTAMIKSVEKLDSRKKANPLDLSADQDLTIALMNLAAIEDGFSAPSDLINFVRDVRMDLMARIVHGDDKVWDTSWRLLVLAAQLMDQGNKSSGAAAYQYFNRSYELYSMFLGINMGLISPKEVKKAVSDIDN